MRAVLLLAATIAGCAYDAPVQPPAGGILNAVHGEVVFAGVGDPSTTFVTLFAADDPGPPAGTGSPVTFSTVGASAFTGPAAGLQSAPWSSTHLPGGSYLVTALMDVDHDFNPFTSVLAGATCGDWGGAHVGDLVTATPAPVTLRGGRLVDDVTVLIGQPFTLERPAFAFVGTPRLALGEILAQSAYPLFRLRPTTIATAFSETLPLTLGPACGTDATCTPDQPLCACDPATVVPCGTSLPLLLVDADGDGVVDPYPAEAQAEAGLLDIWPRVYLEYAGELGAFDWDGQELPERWVSEAFPMALELGGLAQAAGVLPSAIAGQLAPVGVPVPLGELSVTFTGTARHYHADGVAGEDANGPFDLVPLTAPDALPAGVWAVTVVSFTGQTWTVPNDIGALGLPSLDPSFDPTTQGVGVAIAP
ncbi:MAG: hypothetical protein ABMB14_13650 [Myxococcota bacterium]